MLIFSLLAMDVEARGGGQGERQQGGGRRGAGAAPVKRSPVTGSKMNRPVQKPQARPQVRPQVQPQVRPAPRAQVRPQQPQQPRPAPQPAVKPGRPQAKPAVLPTPRPVVRPLPGRPQTKPGKVVYPKPGHPGGHLQPGRPAVRPVNPVVRPRPIPTVTRPLPIKRPAQLPVHKPAWGNKWGKWGQWNRPVRPGGKVVIINNITINNNFRKNLNWGYRPNYWGTRPWWNANHNHHWHHGSWNYGWNRRWYGHYHWHRPRPWPGYVIVDRHNDFADGVAWGLAAWGLGNLIYNIGYQSYRNPYPAPPVQYGNTTIINYSEPITVAAGKLPPGDEATENTAEEKSTAALEASRAAFKQGDSLTALRLADEAIAAVPGDSSMHEYRALVLFSLGKYEQAAGVLNPVLASGPGWDWTTMTGLYGSQSVYTQQLRKLEDYSRAVPDNAAVHFLLGYHYLVCAHLDQAYEQFEQTVKLQPADTIAAQLRDLCNSSISPDSGDTSEDAPAVEQEAPPPVEAAELLGTWVSNRGDLGTVTLSLGEDGKFDWSFNRDGETTDLNGSYSLNDSGLLTLESEDSQMVGQVKLPAESKLNFILAGGPEGDPGMSFDRKL